MIAAAVLGTALAAGSLSRDAPPWQWLSSPKSNASVATATWHAAGSASWLHGEPGNYPGFGPSTLLTCAATGADCYLVVQANGIALNGQAAIPGVAPGWAPVQSSMYRSSDAGQSWASVRLPADTWLSTPVSCPNTEACFVGAVLGTVNTPGTSGQAVLLETSDAGNHWTSTPMPALVGLVVALSCPTASKCVALTWSQEPETIGGQEPYSGASRFFPTTIYATATAGRQWTTWNPPLASGHTSIEMSSVTCPGNQACYIEADQARIIGSPDGYNAQDHVTLVYRTNGWAGAMRAVETTAGQWWGPMYCVRTTCLTLGSKAPGVVEAATIGTTSWKRLEPRGLPTEFAPVSLTCASPNSCFASGDSGIYASTDGGHDWFPARTQRSRTGGVANSWVTNIACDTTRRCIALEETGAGRGYNPAAVLTTPIANTS